MNRQDFIDTLRLTNADEGLISIAVTSFDIGYREGQNQKIIENENMSINMWINEVI